MSTRKHGINVQYLYNTFSAKNKRQLAKKKRLNQGNLYKKEGALPLVQWSICFYKKLFWKTWIFFAIVPTAELRVDWQMHQRLLHFTFHQLLIYTLNLSTLCSFTHLSPKVCIMFIKDILGLSSIFAKKFVSKWKCDSLGIKAGQK